ncbi:MAG: hypothetical protein ACRELB_20730 [Polyangiaceae bacterium]
MVTQVAPTSDGQVFCRVRRFDLLAEQSKPSPTAYWLHEIEPVMGRTIRHEMEARGHDVRFGRSKPPDPAAHLREFCHSGWEDLGSRAVGGAQDVSDVYQNAAYAMHHVREASLAQVGEGFRVAEEVDHALLLINLAAGTVTASLLLHLREARWLENGAASLLRTALEALVSAAALIAGGEHHKTHWFVRRGRIDPSGALPILFELLSTRRADVSDPAVVYSWLSRSVHWELPAIQREGGAPAHEDVYCALAYISWACLVLAEVATGYEGLVAWPKNWSEPLPWVRDDRSVRT